MPRKTKAEKQLENEFDRLFKLYGQNVQFDVFDLGKIDKEVKAALVAGTNGDEAMQAAVAKYRKN